MQLTSKRILLHSLPIPLALFALLFVITSYMVDIEENRLMDMERSQVLIHASATRAQLESELNATLYITSGLIGYITINPKLSGEHDVQKVLQTLFNSGRHLRNIGLAPTNVLTHVYPLKGNEQAIGLEYENHPAQWPAVKRAIESHNTVLAGPVKLVQGGTGLISRTPVFLEDDSYWGILSLVINIDSLLEAAGLRGHSDGMIFALRGEEGMGQNGAIILGDKSIFEQNPIILDITIPGGKWQMASMPTNGWGSNMEHLAPFRIIAAITSLLLTTMLWVIVIDRRAIKHIALHDALTGLANRRLFDERLNYTLLQKQRHQQSFALLAIDLDRFKPINDRHGHKAGDMVLHEMAKRMSEVVRQEDTVARVGGDEFMIILPSTEDMQGAQIVAEKIRQTLSEPFFYQDSELSLSASVGISIYPKDGASSDALLRVADNTMYAMKESDKKKNQQTAAY